MSTKKTAAAAPVLPVAEPGSGEAAALAEQPIADVSTALADRIDMNDPIRPGHEIVEEALAKSGEQD